MKEQLVKSWHLNDEKNTLLLQSISEEALAFSLNTKGRNIGQQLAHMHNNRINWLEFVAKNLYNKADLCSKDAIATIFLLENSFKLSAKKIEEVIIISWEKEGKLPSFKTGLIPFISYLISHESHHRGNILLTLKQTGYTLPDALKWGLWEWGK